MTTQPVPESNGLTPVSAVVHYDVQMGCGTSLDVSTLERPATCFSEPCHVSQYFNGLHEAINYRQVRHRSQDINDRLRGEAKHGRTADMLNSKKRARTERSHQLL